MSENDPDPHLAPDEQSRSQLGPTLEPDDGDPTLGGKRGAVGETPGIASDSPDDGTAYPGRRRRRLRGDRRPAGGRSRRRGVTVRSAAAVLAAAADARATVVLSGMREPTPTPWAAPSRSPRGCAGRGARVLATFPDPFTLPPSLAWLPGADGLVPSSSVPSSPDVFVSLDAASPARLGELAPLLGAAGTSVAIDHHASNPGFGDAPLSTPTAPATVTLVAVLLDELGIALDERLATLLYAGLAADTGSFRFGSTRPDTHELAARLLSTGIDHSGISRRLFDTAPFTWLGLLSVVTGRAVLEPGVGAGLVWDLVEHGGGGRARPARRAARGARRRRPLGGGGRRRLRAEGPGRRNLVGVAALARGHRRRPGGHRAGRRRPPLAAGYSSLSSTGRRPSRRCGGSLLTRPPTGA